MTNYEEPEVVVVSSKGQVVIPQTIREKLRIGPKTKLLVYSYQDGVIMKKLEIPDLAKELEEVYKKVDEGIAKYGELSEEEINEIIQKYRKQKTK